MTGVKHLSMAGPTEAELQSAGLRFTQSGPIAEITLCRPERRNTQSPAMWRALAALGQTMPTDIRVVIVRAEGRSFSAGLDRSMLKDPASRHEAADGETISGLLDGSDMTVARTIREYQDGFLFLRNSNFISIAAVQGHAVGAGFQLALACDLRVVADDATFCMKEVALGLVPDLTGLTPLVRQVGYGRALEICVTARNVVAAEALSLGLAHSVVPVNDLESETRAMAHTLLQADTAAAREVKQLVQSAEVVHVEHQRQLEAAAQTRLLRARSATADGSDRGF
ncbi:enoyl-CoA hydratase/isomerase family protein [Rhodococcus oxybenzonivorans]|uniref:enoyl-CoA hydratase/isomerase family protein n=1 Tax=Rhodococcus oxybenzonivorans TaxID=1990687 RepID=UPI002952B896|nr:enoyl-CoA hydratase/isomerase family protein [Rhodococcus oxybenzonivorans]MDV7357152.1 enoyl-CoA hydratase/isomerase family protein [Rhodococcus oxybenzonivorans]